MKKYFPDEKTIVLINKRCKTGNQLSVEHWPEPEEDDVVCFHQLHRGEYFFSIKHFSSITLLYCKIATILASYFAISQCWP